MRMKKKIVVVPVKRISQMKKKWEKHAVIGEPNILAQWFSKQNQKRKSQDLRGC
jgi:hypothetical protein